MFRKFKNSAKSPSTTKPPTEAPSTNTHSMSFRSSPKSPFALDELNRYGVRGKPIAIAYDPVQGLLAISTSANEIHVYGQQQVEVVFDLPAGSLVHHLYFVKGVYLVALDAKGNIKVFSLLQKKLLYSILAPGKPTALATDPTLDWLLLGMSNGDVLCFDIDRGTMVSFGIENLQRKALPKERLSPVISIQWNPRDIGTLLISYSHCAVVYSMATGEIRTLVQHEKKLTNALYHPNSLNIVTTHEDGSLVFWDALTGKLISEQYLFTRIDQINWLTKANHDDTALLVLSLDKLVHLEFGTAPKYSITSYEKMDKHYSNGKKTVFDLSYRCESFIPLGTASCFFGGNNDPKYILLTTKEGEIEILNFPDGTKNYQSSLFPQSLSWIHPRTTITRAFPVPRKQWLGMISKSIRSDTVLKGGFPAKKPLRSNELRSALITGHTNGYLRLWDASRGELDDSSVIDVDVISALGLTHEVPINDVSFAGEIGELATSLANGDVVLFKFDINRRYKPGRDPLSSLMDSLSLQPGQLVDLTRRTPNIKEGFLPICGFINGGKKGKVTAIKNSEIGFVAIAYENGDLVIIDRRGPAIIYGENMINFSTSGKSSKLTSLEFTICTHGDDGYSSILLFGGSNQGELYTFKILPEMSGRFSAKLIDVVQTNEFSIDNLIPYRIDNGTPSIANMENFNKLADGIIINCAIIISSGKDLRIIRPGGKNKTINSKKFNQEILSIGLSVVPSKSNDGSVGFKSIITTLRDNNTLKIFTNPDLKELSSIPLPFQISDKYWGKLSSILPSGDLMIRVNEAEAELVTILGTGKLLHHIATDRIFNERLFIPYRPSIGTAQWIKGTTLISYADLDLLIGGDKRPASKNPEESAFSQSNVTLFPVAGSPKVEQQDEFAYTKPTRKRQQGGYDPSRQVIHSVQNGFDSVEERFNDYANNASQTINESLGDAKKNLVQSFVKSKFGI